jgi:hypothetical protein
MTEPAQVRRISPDGAKRPADGTEQAGTVLVHAPGADSPALYVALSRHKDRVLLYGSRQELETPQDEYLAGGRPRDDLNRLRRVAEQLAERAAVSERSADDRPVLDDLGQASGPPQLGRGGGGRDSSERAHRGARTAARRIAEHTRLHSSRETSRGPRWSAPDPAGDAWSYPVPDPTGRGNGWTEPEPPRRDRGFER